jgi:peptidyl-prolyl cis-trans isomerase SurA
LNTRWYKCATLALALALASLAGCGGKGGDSEVVAKVNGRKISKSEVDKYFKNQTAGSPRQPTEEEEKRLRLSILRQLIENEVMMQRAEKLGLLATDDEVDGRFNSVKAPFTKEEFEKRLKDRNITEEDFKRDLRRTITVDKVLNKEIASKINISDADVRQYYDAHKAEFNLIEPQYHLAHIFVTGAPAPQLRNLRNDKAQNDAEARKKIQMLYNRLESGEDFATLAMNYSEDADTAPTGGDLGFTPESQLRNTDPTTREAVLKLKAGQTSGIITVVNPATRQPFGYRIVRLIAKEPAGQRDLNDPRVQQAIREQLRERREQLIKSAYYEVVQNQADVENFYAQEILKSSGT